MATKAPERTERRLAPVDVVRAAYAAYNRGDLDEGLSYISPDVEWVLPPSALHGDVLHGPDALHHLLRSEYEAFSEIRREPVELEENGEQVVGFVAQHVRGRSSGIELDMRAPYAFTVRDGLIVRAVELEGVY